LAAEFGAVVDELVTFGLNHMTVVAANLEPWKKLVEKNFETAFRDRFSDPIELEGIRPPQALELARRRLSGGGMEDISRFCDAGWLNEVFREKTPLGVRDFLRICGKRSVDGVVE